MSCGAFRCNGCERKPGEPTLGYLDQCQLTRLPARVLTYPDCPLGVVVTEKTGAPWEAYPSAKEKAP